MNSYFDQALDFPEFTQDEVEMFVEIFQKFDQQNRNAISKTELGEVLKYMGQGVNEKELQELFQILDNDGSGLIEWKEFLRMMRFFYPEKYVLFYKQFLEPAKEFPEFEKEDILVFVSVFREFDLDGNGFLDTEELDIAFKRLGQGVSSAELKDLLDKVDVDKSSTVEWPEFLLMMRYFYPWKVIQFHLTFMEPAFKFPEFTKAEILEFVKCFKEFDLDGSGSIDANELTIALQLLGQGCSEQKAKEILNKYDADNSGEIEWPEFLEIMRSFYPDRVEEYKKTFFEPAKKYPQFSEEEIEVFIQTFREFDEDGSGGIDAKELEKALRWMGEGASPQKVQEIMNTIDTDKSGEIEFGEFLEFMSRLYGPSKEPAPSQPSQSKSAAPVDTSEIRDFHPNVPVGVKHDSANKCSFCGKTVYPVEGIQAVERIFHKGCFKCQAGGCGITLNLKNFKAAQGRVWCQKHVPVDKPTQTTVDGSLSTMNVKNAPKLRKAAGIQKNVRMTFAPGEIGPINPDGEQNQILFL